MVGQGPGMVKMTEGTFGEQLRQLFHKELCQACQKELPARSSLKTRSHERLGVGAPENRLGKPALMSSWV
jgi:hypothetical protein